MIPIGDDNPTLRTPVMTYVLLALMVGTWVVVEKGGTDPTLLAFRVCDFGMVPGILYTPFVSRIAPRKPFLSICRLDTSSIADWIVASSFAEGLMVFTTGTSGIVLSPP